ncbi:hypothetical protein, partial [Lentimicrobium sp. S6]|uniref:hypothetical protein n=1 Tax=Lentimicrobium sp. S6 TaxID=2735872 RepID=UPI001551A1B1
DASENYPHIEAGYDEWSNYNYNFDIAPGITQTRTVEFNIEMTSNQGTWTDVFTIEIHPDNIVYMPELAYAAHNFDPAGEDDDNLPEGGETIRMPVSLFNSGNQMATGTEAILSTQDPDITITDNSENYGEVNINGEEWCDYDYNFDIATGITQERDVEFTLDITSNEGTWTDTFIVTIYPDNASPMPVLEYQAHNFFEAGADDDDLAEGGESIRMPIELLNSGEARATVVSAVISTNDPAITLTDASENYPHIEAGYDEWSNYNYNFDIAPGITQTRTVEFNIEMT